MPDRYPGPALDRRALLRAILAGTAGTVGAAALAACGLPTSGRPVVDGPGLSGLSDSGGTVVKAPVPGDATTPQDLVHKFFGAVAGRVRVPGDLNQADSRAQAFLDSAAKKAWPAGGTTITVVRPMTELTSVGDTSGSTFVDVQVKPIGILGPTGTVDPLPNSVTSEPSTLRFTVVVNGPGYLIHEIQQLSGGTPIGMMLYSTYLRQYYTPQLIYYWSVDAKVRGLVPDIRYVPLPRLSQELQLTEIVDWVLNVPSDLIKDVVQGSAYTGLGIVGPNLTAPGKDGLLVNLTDQPQVLQPEDVMQQLRWSLRPLYEDAVRLQYNGQQQSVDGSSSRFRDVNLADEKYRPDEAKFCVAGGVVRNVGGDPTLPPAPVLANPDDNKDIKLAALNKSLTFTAVVRNDKYLYIGDGTSAKPAFNRANLPPSDRWTRPVFLPTISTQVLVGHEGVLYVVAPNGSVTQQLSGPDVSAFAVAPDGHRLAVISNGAAMVYGLKIGKGDDISLGSGKRVLDAGLTDCTGIAWTGLDRVLVAGKSPNGQQPPQFQLAQVTVDGAIAEVWNANFTTPIASVVALARAPWDMLRPESGEAMVHAGTAGAYTAAPTHTDAIALATPATPTPTASPSGAPVNLGTPSYPFYADYGY